jgi:hypothetical protein
MLYSNISHTKHIAEIFHLHGQDGDEDEDGHKQSIEPPEACTETLEATRATLLLYMTSWVRAGRDVLYEAVLAI